MSAEKVAVALGTVKTLMDRMSSYLLMMMVMLLDTFAVEPFFGASYEM